MTKHVIAREHLEFIASAYRVTSWKEPADRLLAQFELSDRADTPAGELSRGMRQKVAICCGYLHQPRAILLDEPLTGLDPRGIRTMKDSIHQRAAAGAAVMVSSHLLSLVEDLCTSVLILHRGRRSGRQYRTPVMAFKLDRTLVIALLYGEESQWLRNLSAAGGGYIIRAG